MTIVYTLMEASATPEMRPLLQGVSESYKVRKMRELVETSKAPCVRVGKKIFLKPEHLRAIIDNFECRSKSSKSKDLTTGTSAVPSGESLSSRLRAHRGKKQRTIKEES